MKKLLILFVMAGMILTSCNKNKWAEVDYSDDIVGTWTCLEAGYAEALVINADGTIVSTGVEGDHYWEDVNGTYEMVNNKMTMKFDDNDNFEGRFEMIPGETLVLIEPDGERNTYRYCAEDLSEEVIGMWVCHEGLPEVENDMAIFTYSENGKMTMTTQSSAFIPVDFVNVECDYKMVGDLMFKNVPNENTEEGNAACQPVRLAYTANGTTLGDILIEHIFAPSENGIVEITTSWLRIKQNLELSGNEYDYANTYVTNVKGLEQEIDIAGYTFKFSEMDGVMLHNMLQAVVFGINFPDANTINYTCHYNEFDMNTNAPIAVEGNKMTVKMSENNPAFRNVDLYAFQDVDNCQMHIYMPTHSFVNFFSNMQIAFMAELGQLDINDAAAVEAIFNNMDNVVESINLSLIFKTKK